MSRAQLTSTVEQNTGGAVTPYVAGKNKIINGDFGIWQRGTSSTGSNGYVSADRWYVFAGTAPTTAQETTIVPTGQRYSLKLTTVAAGNQPIFFQAIETANAVALAGQNVTLSIYAATSTSTLVSFDIQYSTSVDNSVTGSWTTITPTTGGTFSTNASTMTRSSGLYSIPSNAKSLMVRAYPSSTVASGTSIYLGGVQLEAGSVATPFTTASGTLQGELALCQRYYYQLGGVANGFPIVGGYLNATGNQIRFPISFPTNMRIAPSITVVGTWNTSGNTTQPNPVFINQQGFSIEISSSSGQVPAAYAYPDTSGKYMTINAEL